MWGKGGRDGNVGREMENNANREVKVTYITQFQSCHEEGNLASRFQSQVVETTQDTSTR